MILKRILAAITMFTRLPLWRLCSIPKEYYEHVVPLWPLVGWITGGTMALAFYFAHLAGIPDGVAVALSLLCRVMLTGALHEDGFADFCDGFGGGTSREKTLAIMKDSHIGTYGVLGLALYYLLLWNILTYVLAQNTVLIIIAADSICKYVSSTIIYFLPYARNESESKNRLVYAGVPSSERFISLIIGILPAVLIGCISIIIPAIAATVVASILFIIMKRRINGYTGDCCGATFVITETTFYFALLLAM